jgi:hypothetical protein
LDWIGSDSEVKHGELFDPQRLAAEEIIRGAHLC